MKKMGFVGWLSFILVVVGGLNWGLVGFFQYDLVATIFGAGSLLAKIVYDLVGLGAVYMIISALGSKGDDSPQM